LTRNPDAGETKVRCGVRMGDDRQLSRDGMGWLAGIWAILLALVGLGLIVVGTRMGSRR